MARSEARLLTSIWEDDDFLARSGDAQRMFMFLISQPDLAHDGVIALRERRWARKAADWTVEDVNKALDELATARFVIIDEDHGELLIRSFIREDKVYKQPNVLRAAADHLRLVSSPTIRREIGVELRRVAELPMVKDAAEIIAKMLAACPDPSAEPAAVPIERGTANPSVEGTEYPTLDAPGERGVVTVVSRDSPLPESPSQLTPAADEPLRMLEFEILEGEVLPARPKRISARDVEGLPEWRAFWSAYPRKVDKGHARSVWAAKVNAGADPAEIAQGAALYRDNPKRPAEAQYIPHPGTWLNGERWTDEDTVTAPPRSTEARNAWWDN